MEALSGLQNGFSVVFEGTPLIWTLVGVLIGTVVGVLPGVGPLGAMAVLLPLSFRLDPTSGLLMLAGIYYGSMYGGTLTSVLLNVPGEATSVMTAIEGHRLTARGRAGAALAIGAIASFTAGTITLVALTFAAPVFSRVAVSFAAPEFLALTVFALLVLSRLSGGSLTKAMAAAALGLVIATIGVDPVTGNVRFTFGYTPAVQGINLTSLAVGIFAFAEVFRLAESKRPPDRPVPVKLRDLYPTREEFRRALPAMGRGSTLGFLIGLIPGPAAVMSTFASYGVERRFSKGRHQFGKGAIEGVAGPEAANNGAVGGVMLPLLTLGIPFAAPTALLLAGFLVHGITPGPLLIRQEPDVFWGLIAGMYIGTAMLLILNLPLVGVFVNILRIPHGILAAIILIVSVLGVFATRNSMFDVGVLIVMGALGWLMMKAGLPRAPLLLGFILSTIIERSLQQTLILSRGDPLPYMAQRPIAATLLALTAVVLIVPPIFKLIRRLLVSPPAREQPAPVEEG